MSPREQLLAELRLAFGEVERQPDAELFAEREDYLWSEGLHGGSGPWWEVPAQVIAHEPHALGELTVTGFRFFLPAYLSWVVQNTRSGYTTADNTIYALNSTDCREPLLTERKARYGSLSPAQHAVVAKFLAWAAAEDDLDAQAASRALASYWSRIRDDA